MTKRHPLTSAIRNALRPLRPLAWLLPPLVAWALLGSGFGCGPVVSAPPSCLAGASTIETASAGNRSYVYEVVAKAVDALGVSWLDGADNGVEIGGSQAGCWHGGKVSGPYLPGVAVYECTSQHCPAGSCPSPCLEYHTTAALQMDSNGPPLTIEDLCMEHYGDGISMYADSGDITARRIHARELLDDTIENDFCDASFTLDDSFFDDVATAMATRLRSSASGDCSSRVWAIRNSLVKIKRPGYWYREGDRPGQRAGHVYKLNSDGNQPQFVVTDSVFVVDRASNGTGDQSPPLNTLIECRNNVILFAGTPADTAAILAEVGHGDGNTNGQRLAALQAMGCYLRAGSPRERDPGAVLGAIPHSPRESELE